MEAKALGSTGRSLGERRTRLASAPSSRWRGKAQDPPGAVGEKLHEPLQGKAPLQVELGVEEGEGHLRARDAEGGP